MTFKEKWDWVYSVYSDCPPYLGDYKVTKDRQQQQSIKISNDKRCIDRKNILLFMPLDVTNYAPRFDCKGLGYTEDEKYYIMHNACKPGFDFNKYPIRYRWNLGTPFQEKKIRSFDCVGGIIGDAFFIHDRLLECWHDLIDKDLQIIPAECCTKNGPVTEFHLVKVVHEADGLDPELTGFVPYNNFYYREVPKATNDFMNGAQIAKDRTWWIADRFYIVPELVDKTLKYLHKKKLKDVDIMTFKEEWDLVYGAYSDCPPYLGDYKVTKDKQQQR